MHTKLAPLLLVALCLVAPLADSQSGTNNGSNGNHGNGNNGNHNGHSEPIPSISLGATQVTGATPYFWQGATLDEIGVNQEERTFDVTVPSDFWTQRTGGLVVAIRWPLLNASGIEPVLSMAVYDGSGNLVAEGERGNWANPGAGVLEYTGRPLLEAACAAAGNSACASDPQGGSAIVAVLDRPASGVYQVVVRAEFGQMAYGGSINFQWRDPATEVTDLLPNLVSIPPNQLRIGANQCNSRLDTPRVPAPVRCLRFAIASGNTGQGALEIHLPPEDGALSFASMGNAVQRIQRSDETTYDVPVGRAEFHAMHGHFHYSGADVVTLHTHDLATGQRGPMLGTATKMGLCYADLSLVTPGLTWTTQPKFDGVACADPTVEGEWVAGQSPNWYDLYPATYPDQYIEVSGVPDGVYELAVRVNGGGSLVETTATDNEASTIFRITGDTIQVLGTRSPVPLPP